jgi:hypothetical protein
MEDLLFSGRDDVRTRGGLRIEELMCGARRFEHVAPAGQGINREFFIFGHPEK